MTPEGTSSDPEHKVANQLELPDNSVANVGRQTRRGITWSFVGAVVTNAIRLVVLAVLGRTLTKDDFGVVAAAISVNVVVFGIRDLGIGVALVQRKDLKPGHLATAFALSTYLGLTLSAALFAAAPWIGRAYGIVESIDVIRGLAAMFAIRSVATPSRMMCQRAMNFRLLTMIDSLAFALGSITSVVCAIAGAGPWSLVVGYLVEEATAGVWFLIASPPKFSLTIDRQHLRDLLDFGGGYSVVLIANLVATFGDNMVVGRVHGAGSLGFYSRAYDLMRYPSMVFEALVGNVLFPAYARLQQNPSNVAVSFRRVTFVNALLLLPASAALIVVAPETIRLTLGSGWQEVVLPFQILMTATLFRTSLKLGTIAAQALGAVNSVAIAYVVYAAILVGGALVTVRWGIVGVAASTAISISIASLHTCLLAVRVANLPTRAFVVAHLPGLLLAVVAVAAVWPVTLVLRAANLPAAVIFVAGAASSIAVCILGLAVGLRTHRGDFAWLGDELRRARNKLTRRAA